MQGFTKNASETKYDWDESTTENVALLIEEKKYTTKYNN